MEAVFAAEADRLRSLAYRMLGTPDDADDVVQDAWLRWAAADQTAIENPAAWLTTVTTRLAIDRLRSAQQRRESYVGPWLPEPVAIDSASDPEAMAASTETLTLGFLAVLERLAPVERAVFLLHDVFGYGFAEVAAIVERSEPATRQIASRARARVRADRVRVDRGEPERVEVLADAFLAAVYEGEVETLASLLTDDVVLTSDGGAEHHAARRPVKGAAKVARFIVNIAKRAEPGTEVHAVAANGQRAWYVTVEREPFLLIVPAFREGRIAEFLMIRNPDKLRTFHRSWAAGTG